MRKTAVFRIRIITTIVLCIALALIARLYYIQVYMHEYYNDRANKQYVHTVQNIFDRGNIFFSTRDDELVSAATIQSGYVLAVDPTQIQNVEAVYEAIDEFIVIDKELFVTRATLPKRTYVEIHAAVTEENADAIAALDLDGLLLYRTQWRYYPGDYLSARTIGFTSLVDDGSSVPKGRYGLEQYYDDTLARDPNKLTVNFFAEIFSSLGALMEDNSNERVGDLVTTIEPTVARMLQTELQKANDTWNSNLTGGIIIDPKTGEIYALDAVPGYNLNDRTGATVSDFRNPLVENVYELGSIIKALTMAAGLDSGAVTADTTYFDSGKLELDTFTIGNYDGRGRGTVDMQQVLNQSLNTGVAFIADRMGKEEFRRYFKGLKLGTESGVDLPNETFGLISNLDSPREIEYATASFGQGIALTPIAAVRALSTLANGGYLITPHIGKKIVYENGEENPVTFPQGEAVFTPETSEEISRMLTGVVDDALRGGTVKLENYSVAAKTGTAQIADPTGGGYYDDRYLHSFFGYFPSYDPQFLVFLYTVEPKGVQYASETLTDTFMNLTKFLINYYSIPADR